MDESDQSSPSYAIGKLRLHGASAHDIRHRFQEVAENIGSVLRSDFRTPRDLRRCAAKQAPGQGLAPNLEKTAFIPPTAGFELFLHRVATPDHPL